MGRLVWIVVCTRTKSEAIDIPSVKKRESKKAFINRCIPMLMDEGRERPQAIAMCFSIWKRRKV